MADVRHEMTGLPPGKHHKLLRVTRLLPFLNPTQARYALPVASQSQLDASPAPNNPSGSYQVHWNTRDNRKGRHTLVVPPDHPDSDSIQLTTTWSAATRGIWRMVTVWAYWDVSWWIAFLFTVGSAIFVISGAFYWVPLVAPNTEFHNEGLYGGGITSFVGATLFQVGAMLLIVEAVNENQSACFGWELEQALPHVEKEGQGRCTVVHTGCTHHHPRDNSLASQQRSESDRKWEWWPTWRELTSHYFRELGFLASFTMMIGATIFYVSGIMALPGIVDKLSTPVLYGTFWLAYLVGGVFFIISSFLYMLETQPNWYTPAPHVLGWWVGIWNMIGSVGWTLSAAFGYCAPSWCEYQSDLSLLWASIAFLIGSALLWYEALDKYPVVRDRK